MQASPKKTTLVEMKTWVCICPLHSLLCYHGDRQLCQNLVISSSKKQKHSWWKSLQSYIGPKCDLAPFIEIPLHHKRKQNYSLTPLFSSHLFLWIVNRAPKVQIIPRAAQLMGPAQCPTLPQQHQHSTPILSPASLLLLSATLPHQSRTLQYLQSTLACLAQPT